MGTTAKKILNIALDVLTGIFALIGVLSVISIVISSIFGISIVLFATNSMSPAIPQNSAALAIRIPAAEIQVGDVVTVDREGQMPISHRVVEVTKAESSDPGARILVLKGDDNKSVDPVKYQVTEVRRIFFSVPGIAPVVTLISDPRMLIAMAIVVAGLLARAFWRPRAEQVQS